MILLTCIDNPYQQLPRHMSTAFMTIKLRATHQSLLIERGLPSMAKGVGLRRLSHRGSWVQIPPPALEIKPHESVFDFQFPLLGIFPCI